MAVKRRACSKCGKNRAEKFYVSTRGRVCSFCRKRRTRVASRDVRLQETYGITEDDYQRLLQAGGGLCWICLGKRPGNLDVDHDHKLEKAGVPPRETVRGLLCRRCNRRLLPSVRDQIEILENAIAYLRSDLAQQLLSTSDTDR